MKKTMLGVAAALSLGLCALAQGSFDLDDTYINPGLAVDTRGNWYGGTFGMEVWELNSTSVPLGINLDAAPGAGVLGYNAMVAAGFVKEKTFAGQTTVSPGDFELGIVDLWDARPAGGTVVVALAAWNTSDPSWSAMLANRNQATRAGILAFDQPTTNPYFANPGEPPTLAMSQDLVLSTIPEPPSPALAGLGGALLLLLRRRRHCVERMGDEE
jgi:MYXO-CTERM domain-containing protein